jgi:hypothetical protein
MENSIAKTNSMDYVTCYPDTSKPSSTIFRNYLYPWLCNNNFTISDITTKLVFINDINRNILLSINIFETYLGKQYTNNPLVELTPDEKFMASYKIPSVLGINQAEFRIVIYYKTSRSTTGEKFCRTQIPASLAVLQPYTIKTMDVINEGVCED